MVVSVYAPERLSVRKWRTISSYIGSAAENGFRPLVLVAASPEKGQDILSLLEQEDGIDMDLLRDSFFYSDYKPLITLNRSNGGAT